jgi:hypothetical protein
MKKYVTIYSFQAMNKIEVGETVYMLDRDRHAVFCVNDLSVYEFMAVLKADAENSERFEFWHEQEVDENAEL